MKDDHKDPSESRAEDIDRDHDKEEEASGVHLLRDIMTQRADLEAKHSFVPDHEEEEDANPPGTTTTTTTTGSKQLEETDDTLSSEETTELLEVAAAIRPRIVVPPTASEKEAHKAVVRMAEQMMVEDKNMISNKLGGGKKATITTGNGDKNQKNVGGTRVGAVAVGVAAHGGAQPLPSSHQGAVGSEERHQEEEEIEPTIPGPVRRGDRVQQQPIPGAYLGAPGGNLQRTSTLDYTMMGAQAATNTTTGTAANTSGFGGPTTAAVGNQQLVQAREVIDVTEYGDLEHADPMEFHHPNAEEQEQKQQQERKKQQLTFLFISFLLLVATATIVGTLIGTAKQQESSGAAPLSVSPSQVPSAAPTGALDLLLMDLPSDTLERINSGSETPQWKAWNWLSNHYNITYFPEWKKKQLFALGTFFYAFAGVHWHPLIQERWMDYSKDECQWYSAGFGWIVMDQYVEFPKMWQQQPCNKDGQFTDLWLAGLELQGLEPAIPPELALLTNLSGILLGDVGLDMAFADLLPPEIYQLDKIVKLEFGRNFMTGTLPTELGLFTNLRHLWMEENLLSGAIPTEIGEFTGMTALSVAQNTLSGSIPPTTLGAMSSLLYFDAYNNMLTGSLGSELGLLGASLGRLLLQNNTLSGTIPTEIGKLSNLKYLNLAFNELSGTLPSEFGLVTTLNQMSLQHNNLSGVLPKELNASNPMRLEGNHFSGAVPEHLCSVFMCNDCSKDDNSNNGSAVSSCTLLEQGPTWPGLFPPPPSMAGTTAMGGMSVMLNILTDWKPRHNTWAWQQLDTNRSSVTSEEVWDTLQDSGGPLWFPEFLYSHILPISSNSTYRLVVSDRFRNGLMDPTGWITLTTTSAAAAATTNQTVLYSSSNGRFSEIVVRVEVKADWSVEAFLEQLTH